MALPQQKMSHDASPLEEADIDDAVLDRLHGDSDANIFAHASATSPTHVPERISRMRPSGYRAGNERAAPELIDYDDEAAIFNFAEKR